MYVDISESKQNGKTYKRILLRESYREDGKVKHRTIANLTGCSEEEVEAIKFALKNKKNLSNMKAIEGKLETEQGPCVGAVMVLKAISDRIGITTALGNSRMGKLALWQVMARVIDQGSRLSAVRLCERHAGEDILKIDEFDEDDLYENLDWLSTNQSSIENALFDFRYKGKDKPKLYLYDVTSSYLEGVKNEFGEWGYNRDKKRGKLQIVIGLMVDGDGNPVAVEVFKGNTNDLKTVSNQIHKLAVRFGVKEVTLVGDRGIIKSLQVDELRENGFHYITGITRPQIESLIKSDVIQASMFDEKICEVTNDNIRYMLRKNPVRVIEIRKGRQEKITKISRFIESQNLYIDNHKRADIAKQKSKIDNWIKRLRLSNILTCDTVDGKYTLVINEEEMNNLSLLDGCYVIKTDLNPDAGSSDTIHSRYKDLACVERGFRTMKTGLLEARPIFVRKESRTRGHVFVVMLAYMIVHELEKHWSNIDVTVEEGIKELSTIDSITIKAGEKLCHQIPRPRGLGQRLLQSAGVSLPEGIPYQKSKVATKTKLVDRRKPIKTNK